MTDLVQRLEAAAEAACHEEQMTVWSGGVVGALSMANFLRDDLSYDEGLELHAEIEREIKRIVSWAFTHPEAIAALSEGGEMASSSRLDALKAEVMRQVGVSESTAEIYATAFLKVIAAPPEGGEMVRVPKYALDWLMGEGPDANGRWFGERSPLQNKPIGPYWWRSEFRAMIAAAPASIKENGDV